MERPKVNSDNFPCTIKEFFTEEDYEKLSDYQKMNYCNIRQNFEAMREYGMPVQPPEFMVRTRAHRDRQARWVPPPSSSTESDEDWLPASSKKKKKRFQPPKRRLPTPKPNKPFKQACGTKKRKRKPKPKEPDVEPHVYPFRKKRMTSYMALTIPDDDDFLYCEECNFEYDGDCPFHGPLNVIEDIQVPESSKATPNPDHALNTLPDGLVVKKSKIKNAGLGVFATKFFPTRSRFGPYGGKKVKDGCMAQESGYSWQIYEDDKVSHYVDANDPSDSNWMRFVNCARSEDEQCVTAYQFKGQIYYRSHRDIHPGTEILVYYGDSYAKELGIKVQKIGMPVNSVVKPKEDKVRPEGLLGEADGVFACPHCKLAFNHPRLKARHLWKKHGYRQPEFMFKNLQQKTEMTINNQDKSTEQSNTQVNLSLCKSDGLDVNNDFVTKDNSIVDNVVSNTNKKSGLCKTSNYLKNNISCPAPWPESNKKSTTREDIADTCQDICLVKNKSVESYKKFKCEFCHKLFKTNSDLQAHRRVHTGERPFGCETCGQRFSQISSLNLHKQTHSGVKSHVCETCGKGFVQKSNLDRHKQSHSGIKSFVCGTCGKSFGQKVNLDAHKRIHTGEKSFRCDVCGYLCNRHGNLVIHKRIHTGDKLFSCDICGFSCTHSSNLIRHKRMHTGETYKCEICNKAWTNSRCLTYHQKKYHP